MTDMRLAEKVLARGLNLSEGEPGWEAYHLAKDVLELREAAQEVQRTFTIWQFSSFKREPFLALSRAVAALSQQEAGRDEDFDRDEDERERIERTFAP